MLVQRTLFNTTGATGDDGLNAGRFQMLQDRVRIVGLVSRQPGRFELPQQRQRFDQRMNLGARPSARPADRLITVFLAAPAACWWARMMVLSIKASSKSASPASSANTACHTCARDHLAKRLYTLFHAPKSCGRSRHGLPVRAIQSTASTNSRLSAAVRPGSVILPGSNDAIRPYCSSLSISLDILFLRKRQDVNRFFRKLTPPFAMIVN